MYMYMYIVHIYNVRFYLSHMYVCTYMYVYISVHALDIHVSLLFFSNIVAVV